MNSCYFYTKITQNNLLNVKIQRFCRNYFYRRFFFVPLHPEKKNVLVQQGKKMSYFTIYFIGLTVVFAIYYVAMVVLDLKAKDEVKSDVETIDVPKPAPNEPPTDVEETDNGYVIKNGNASDDAHANSGNSGSVSHGDKADNVISHLQGQFKPVKVQSEAELISDEMLNTMLNGGVTPAGQQISSHYIRM